MAAAITRRAALASALLLPVAARAADATAFEVRLSLLEARSGGRLGVAALDTTGGVRIVYRAYERFALCSTFKLLAAACVLARVDRGEERLDRQVFFTAKDLVTYSPATKERVGVGMSVAELCAAAITLSDNTAGNLLLASFGGPPALTEFARSLGDTVTRLDRWEAELNEATPGDLRDTTAPAAMLEDMRRLIVGDALSASSREQFKAWLLASKTGAARLHAGVPPDWQVGDKTGSGNHGAANDVAILWPPHRAPILVAAYFAESPLPPEGRDAVLAEVGRIVAALI